METSNLILRLTPVFLGLIVILGAWWSLRMYKRGEAGAKTWIFAVLAIAAPWFGAASVGTLHLHMMQPSFCGSCHIMQPFRKDLSNLHSDGLAAKHFQNNWVPKDACYTCHNDYGALGGAKAKISGLRHVYAFYVKGQKDNPKLLKPYDNHLCLRCHGGDNRRYKAEVSHLDNAEEISNNSTSCVDCHSPVHNTQDLAPEGAKKGNGKGGGHD